MNLLATILVAVLSPALATLVAVLAVGDRPQDPTPETWANGLATTHPNGAHHA